MLYSPPENIGLDILHLDELLIILNKPSGLLSVPGRGEDKRDSLMTRVQAEFPTALNIHRLDMDTSGIVIMSLNKRTQSKLSKLFQQRAIEKQYLATVSGKPEQQEGTIDLPLICDWPNRPRQIVDHATGKASQTHYECCYYDELNDATQVLLTPLTGRTHQLRVHLQALGHPILGDNLYGSPEIYRQADRLLLHASKLAFTHPATGENLLITCPAPFPHQANHFTR
ncbi:MAG: RluA family pseudouridine synthase [Methylococcaceae bacterium]